MGRPDDRLVRPAAVALAVTRLFGDTFTLVAPAPLPQPVCRGPDDDVVLATALAGECAAVVTGDKDLLILDPFRGVHLIRRRRFGSGKPRPSSLPILAHISSPFIHSPNNTPTIAAVMGILLRELVLVSGLS